MSAVDPTDFEMDRAMGALLGGALGALGDALGMPTQSNSRVEIVAAFGEITDFEAPRPITRSLTA